VRDFVQDRVVNLGVADLEAVQARETDHLRVEGAGAGPFLGAVELETPAVQAVLPDEFLGYRDTVG